MNIEKIINKLDRYESAYNLIAISFIPVAHDMNAELEIELLNIFDKMLVDTFGISLKRLRRYMSCKNN